MDNNVQKGDVGLAIVLEITDGDTPIDLTGATETKIKFRKPSGETGEFPATIVGDPVEGKIEYTTASEADLDEVGIWYFQAYIRYAAGERWPTNVGKLHVLKNLFPEA